MTECCFDSRMAEKLVSRVMLEREFKTEKKGDHYLEWLNEIPPCYDESPMEKRIRNTGDIIIDTRKYCSFGFSWSRTGDYRFFPVEIQKNKIGKP